MLDQVYYFRTTNLLRKGRSTPIFVGRIVVSSFINQMIFTCLLGILKIGHNHTHARSDHFIFVLIEMMDKCVECIRRAHPDFLMLNLWFKNYQINKYSSICSDILMLSWKYHVDYNFISLQINYLKFCQLSPLDI